MVFNFVVSNLVAKCQSFDIGCFGPKNFEGRNIFQTSDSCQTTRLTYNYTTEIAVII
jgi:hypothetical protein